MAISKMLNKQSLKETIFKEFLKNTSLGPSEMTERLEANYNSVKAAFAKLTEEGLLERAGRGNYEPSVVGILLSLIERIEALESRI